MFRDWDEPSPSAGTFPTIAEKFISPILHAPQPVLPFAQTPYHLRISGRDDVRSIASALVGAKGSDLMLISLAAATFGEASWPTRVRTGRYMYPVVDNARNVGASLADSPTTFEMKRDEIQRIQRGLRDGRLAAAQQHGAENARVVVEYSLHGSSWLPLLMSSTSHSHT